MLKNNEFQEKLLDVQEGLQLSLIDVFEQSHGKVAYEEVDKSSISYNQTIEMLENSLRPQADQVCEFSVIGGRELHGLNSQFKDFFT